MAPEDFDHAVIVKILQEIQKKVDGIKEQLDRAELKSEEDFEELTTKIDNINLGGQDYALEEY